eukprot:2169411-Lingulodinium_polyedra.AAC.1
MPERRQHASWARGLALSKRGHWCNPKRTTEAIKHPNNKWTQMQSTWAGKESQHGHFVRDVPKNPKPV